MGELNLRRRVARRLGFWADRLAPEEAFRKTHIGFEFVTGKGIVTNTEGHGCPLWYQGREDYEKAHERQTERDRQESERLANFMRDLEAGKYETPAPSAREGGALSAAVQFQFQAKPVEHCGAVLDNGKLLAATGTAYVGEVTCTHAPGHMGAHRATVRGFPCRWSAEWVKH